MIKVTDLNFAYKEKEVLKNINFSADSGEVISLIGPNGCGKSTLLRVICGILPSKNGKVMITNTSINNLSNKELAKQIAFLPQFQEKMNGVSVWELVSLGRAPYQKSGWLTNKEDKAKIKWAIDYMSLSEYVHIDVEKLSGGERQRVWIAMVLAQDTPIILLDEPVTYMDIRYQCQLINIVKGLKEEFAKTVIAVFHDINHAIEVSDKIYLMKDGKVFDFGHSDQVISEQNIRDVYGVHAHVCRPKPCCRNVVIPSRIC
ncbi:MAG: ABC transporter ATP-binding protein [Eubacteriales bacterium]